MTRRANRYNIGRTSCHPEMIVKLGEPEEKVRYRNGDTNDIVETILAMDGESHRWIHTDAAANCLRGESDADTLRNVWAFVKGNLQYRIDKTGHEKVKSPRALFSTGHGDCKSYSIAEGALLRALGIRYKYRFAAYGPGDFSHVYIIARTRDGWAPLDAVHTDPMQEVPYYRKKDIEPPQNAAIGAINADKWNPDPGGTKWTPTPGGTKWTPTPDGTKWIPSPAGEVIETTTAPAQHTDWKNIGLLAILFYLLAK